MMLRNMCKSLIGFGVGDMSDEEGEDRIEIDICHDAHA
jgi:hypothetical protein